MLLSLLKKLRSRQLLMCSYMSRNRFPLWFSKHHSYPNIDFFLETGFFFKFTKLLISNLKNQPGKVWTARTKVLPRVSFFNGLPFTWSNWILTLSSCPYIDWLIVEMRWLISTTRTSTMTHRYAEISTHFYLLFKYVFFVFFF